MSTIDTLKYAKRLEAAGFNRIQAEELAEILRDDRKERDDRVATATDIDHAVESLKHSTKADINLLSQRIDSLPDKIMWQLVKYGGIFYAVIRSIEFLVALYLKKAGS
jgi:hypothetical protein